MYHSQAAGIYTAFWLAQVLWIWIHMNDGNHLHLSSCSYALFPGSGNLTATRDLSSYFSMSSAPPGTAAALSSPWQCHHSAVYNPYNSQSQSTQATACLSAVCQHDLPWAIVEELPKCSGIYPPGGTQFPLRRRTDVMALWCCALVKLRSSVVHSGRKQRQAYLEKKMLCFLLVSKTNKNTKKILRNPILWTTLRAPCNCFLWLIKK